VIANFVASLRQNPELAVFLTLALGFLLGRVRFGTFKLGNVVGTLLAGVLIGQLAIKVHPLVEMVFFDLFLFATGYKVGPQFFRGLKKNAVPQVSPTVVLCVTSLVVTVVAAKLLGYDCGTTAGRLAGAFTESTVIGTAGDTIARLSLPDPEKQRLLNNIPVAYAVSYLVGTGFVVWFLSSLAPKLLGVDLKAESQKLEAQMSAAHRTVRLALGLPGVGHASVSPSRRFCDSSDRRFGEVLCAGTRVY
jgi:putative transport protein